MARRLMDEGGAGIENHDARGGGNATASGVTFQAGVGAILCAHMLAERAIGPALGIAGAVPRRVRMETDAAVDDILVETAAGGNVFVQAKTRLTGSSDPASPVGRVADQIARVWLTTRSGDGRRGWDRPLDPARDRIVIAVSSRSPNTAMRDLGEALQATRAGTSSALPKQQAVALANFHVLLAAAFRAVGFEYGLGEVGAVSAVTAVALYDVDGPDRDLATELLRDVVIEPDAATGAYDVVLRVCGDWMRTRSGGDAETLRRELAASGVRLQGPPAYADDVAAVRRYGARAARSLADSRTTRMTDAVIDVTRDCASAILDGCRSGSLLLVGEPGSGKSALMAGTAERIRAEGLEVVELAADRLPIETLEGLRAEIGIDRPLVEVLSNWPGSGPAILFVDALDATRGERSEAVLRSLIEEVTREAGGRWRVIASIRTFDLRMGERFRRLFRGPPPEAAHADREFGDVRHVFVRPWSDREFGDALAQAPELGVAMDRGGERLRELARVPLNTRLVAELIEDGLPAEAFHVVASQVQLLDLYWRRRVLAHGIGAEVCVGNVVSRMVADRALRAPRLEIAKSDPASFERLQREGVLVSQPGDRHVAFRHHVLFDYAASRVHLDPDRPDEVVDLVGARNGLGLFLGPALTFVLQELWRRAPGGGPFWRLACRLAGDPGCDAVARSVAARCMADLPTAASDVRPLLDLVAAEGDPSPAPATAALPALAGTVAISVEDHNGSTERPWSILAAGLGRLISERVAWPLRTLLQALVGRCADPRDRADLGTAARSLLDYALTHEGDTMLVRIAVGFACDTLDVDPEATRPLLQRLLEPARFDAHRHEDLPSLTHKIAILQRADPAFAVVVYGLAFGTDVEDDAATALGHSQILRLSSNRRQDFEMARYDLRQGIKAFFDVHPLHAADAVIAAIEGHVALHQPQVARRPEQAVDVRGTTVRLLEDDSAVCAWDAEGDGDANETAALLSALVSHLRAGSPAQARAVVERVIATNGLAVVWARCLMAAASRPAELGDLLWPVATCPEFTFGRSTRKDATDLIAARYPFETPGSRAGFEEAAMAWRFQGYADPEAVRREALPRLFGAVGGDRLETDDARRELRPSDEAGGARNARPFEIRSWSAPVEPWWNLDEAGVDTRDPLNAELLTKSEHLGVPTHGDPRDLLRDDVARIVGATTAFSGRMDAAARAGADPRVLHECAGAVAIAVSKVTVASPDVLREVPGAIADLTRLARELATHTLPVAIDGVEGKYESALSWQSPAPRLFAATAIMNLARLGADTAADLDATIRLLSRDKHPAVRSAVAQRTGQLLASGEALAWDLAEAVAEREANRAVLRMFAENALPAFGHVDPARAEPMALRLHVRAAASPRADKAAEKLLNATSGMVSRLWLRHGLPVSGDAMRDWALDPARFDRELHQAAFAAREALVLGYGSEDRLDVAIRRHAQAFVTDALGVSARGLMSHLSAPRDRRDDEGARAFARVLEDMAAQIYFASGAFRQQNAPARGLADDAERAAFLLDMKEALSFVAATGTPPALHHLTGILEFLADADPGGTFDLLAAALTGAGRRLGYNAEPLGADRVVKLMGRYLADHRGLFADEARRAALVAALDVFIEVGWPDARRLLHRLPDLLR